MKKFNKIFLLVILFVAGFIINFKSSKIGLFDYVYAETEYTCESSTYQIVNGKCYRYVGTNGENYAGGTVVINGSTCYVNRSDGSVLYQESAFLVSNGKCYLKSTESEPIVKNNSNSNSNSSKYSERGMDATRIKNDVKTEVTAASCQSLLGDPGTDGDPAYYISFAFKVIRYVAIAVLVLFTIFDFVSAVSSSDNDQLQKAVNKVILRLVLCIIIFLLPIFIDLLLNILNDSQISDCLKIN